jgi:hypothetical protein
MGGGKNENKTDTDQSVTDQRIAAADEGVAIGAGGSYSITTIDPGAVSLGETALSIAETVTARLIDFAGASGARADAIAGQVAQGDGEKIVGTVKFLAGAAVAIAAVLAITK